ncbi:MAG: hypothetical protein N3E48_00265 [Candidatus Bathyarchaeota archaeon]|nr:hypothetical protein [Candidatus Bathyarchaeota archaeon]
MKTYILVVLMVVCILTGVVGGYSVGYVTYESKIKSYEGQIYVLTSEVFRLNSTISSQEKEILLLQTQLMEEQAKTSNLISKILVLETEISKAKGTISYYETQTSSLKSQLSNLQTQLAQSQSQIASLERQVSSLQSQISLYKMEISALQSKLNKILNISVTQHYEWDYVTKLLSERYQLDLQIPLSLYVEYRERPRPYSTASYVDMAKDPKDDIYIDKIVQQINNVATRKGFTELEKVNFVAAFVQSLPYTVDRETTPYDEYPRYPIETLFDRGGDCEDTSLLTAAILDRMGYDVALLWLKNAQHVAVGVSISGVYGSYYEYGGKKYFYLETTGEGWRVGELPPDITDTKAYVYPLRP